MTDGHHSPLHPCSLAPSEVADDVLKDTIVRKNISPIQGEHAAAEQVFKYLQVIVVGVKRCHSTETLTILGRMFTDVEVQQDAQRQQDVPGPTSCVRLLSIAFRPFLAERTKENSMPLRVL